MAAIRLEDLPRLSPAVHGTLGRLRRRVRRYVWLEGLCAAGVLLGAAFWISLAVDWLLEPPRPIRGLLLAAAGAGLAFVLVRLVARRLFVPLSDGNMAMLLERRFPELDDSLLTSVALTEQWPAEAGYDPLMLARTCRLADERLAAVHLPKVFNPRPLLRKAAMALGLSALIAGLAVAAPEALQIWARRNLLLAERSWPRKIRLEAVGFADGAAKVASGADFDLLVQALPGDTQPPVVPEAVEVRYRIAGGPRGRRTMSRLGVGPATAAAGQVDPRTVLQEYGFTFRGLLADVRFDVLGGDARLRDLRIDVVPNPTLTAVELELRYPAYMDRPPHTLAIAGAMQVPLATRVVVCGRANKELRSVRIDFPPAERRPAAVQILEGQALAADRMGFRYALAPMRRDTTLLFTLLDADGIKSREPIPLALVAVADEPPQLAVRLAGIGTAITPAARLPVAGSVSDDYGIARVWYEYAVDQHPPATAALATLAKHPTEFVLRNAALEARELKLARGQKLSLAVKAADLCDLGRGPNVGSSETWLLDVVSPEELRAMLEARELVLRQRFESIVEEMTEGRDLLLRMDFSAPGPPAAKPATKPADKAEAKAAVKPAADKAAGAEPGDQPLHEENLSPAQRAERRTERVLQALQNCRKNAQETLGVADSIDDIRQQLANNRIDTEELKNRLGAGIAEPLRRICEQMFPELERRLEALQAATADLLAGPARRDAARRQADDILLAMRKVLSRMVELEDFNELVDRLRTIIRLQQQISKQTQERHRERIQDLLEK